MTPQPLPVIFRIEADTTAKERREHPGVYVVAVFPTEPSTNDPYTATCYAHVGQHSGCRKSWYHTTRAARPDEYADLLAELRSIYERPDDPDRVRLVVTHRWTQQHDAARRLALREQR